MSHRPQVSRMPGPAPRPPALLTMPEFCGTLAAARCLGAHGVEIWMGGAEWAAPARYSRHVTRRLQAPSPEDADALLGWLLEVGRSSPGAVLYPTSDDLAWLQAHHAEALAPYFRLYAPPAPVIERLLDKRSLLEACRRAGLGVPESRYPETDEDVERLARELGAPLLLKQRTQVFSSSRSKGRILSDVAEVPAAYRTFVAENSHGTALSARMPDVSRPLLQAFHREGVSSSLLVAGFIDRSGELFVARAANKILQQPRTLGIALCLEEAELEPELRDGLRRLCRDTGYFGVFQTELLTTPKGRLLIDFNPRYYHYLAFTLARGLPLPLFAYLGATGDEARLEEEVRKAQARPERQGLRFTHALHLHELLLAQALARTMPAREALGWVRWFAGDLRQVVDAVHDSSDPWPTAVAAARQVLHRVKHPRSFIRHIALDR